MIHVPDPTFLLFVYGTLMQGGERHHVLREARPLGPARTKPLYRLLHLGDHPGLVTDGEQAVPGELYEVASAARPGLDVVEGSPDLFDLDVIELADVTGPVFAYYYRRSAPNAPTIERWPP